MAVSSEGRVAIYLQDKHPLREAMDYARYAEERGFEAVWQAESRLVREATVPMAAYAAVTERIKVGSGVVNNWTRNVGLLAATFVTLDDLAPGRADGLRLGTSGGVQCSERTGETEETWTDGARARCRRRCFPSSCSDMSVVCGSRRSG